MMTPIINDYRRELKPKIIAVAAEMFRENGIRAVKMDDISHQLAISKRTLYELYPNKEELVIECIKTQMAAHEKAFRAIIPANASVMDILILFFKEHIHDIAEMNPVLYDELMTYPRMKQLMDEHRDKHAEDTIRFFKRGVEEGFFIPDVDMELVHRMNIILSEQIRNQHLHNDFSMDRIFRVLIQLFIRGFCTLKGIEVLDKAIAEFESSRLKVEG